MLSLMPRVVVAVLLIGLPVTLDATGILAFRTPDRVVLAGDELVIRSDATGRSVAEPECKLQRAGRWWLLHGGLTLVRGAPHHPDVDMVNRMRGAVAGAATLREALRALAAEWASMRASAALFVASPAGREVVDGGPVFQTVVGGVEGGVPSVAFYGVVLAARAPATFSEHELACPGQCPDGRVYAGWSRAEGPLVAMLTRRPAWLDRGDGAAAVRLLALQAAATPGLVGPPFDALEIAAAGARWVARDPQSACAAATQ